MRNRTLTTIVSTVLATAALGAIGTTTASADSAVYAHTPSGNIACRANWSPAWGSSLVCTVADPGRTFRISTEGNAYEGSYKPIARRGRTLRYGGVYDLGGFRCESLTSGLICSRDRDEGFFSISRESSYASN